MVFPGSAIAAMLSAAEAAHPYEACGLLLGAGAGAEAEEAGIAVDWATAERNVHPEPHGHFEIDPTALIAAHKAGRSGGPAVLGYWHSHPNGRASLSEEDRAMAAGDGRLWAIVANGAISVWIDAPEGFKALSYVVRCG